MRTVVDVLKETWKRGAFGNADGAAGSFVVLLVWIYNSSQVPSRRAPTR